LALLKRGVTGTYHNVSKKYLPLYLGDFQFRYNHRKETEIFGKVIAACWATGESSQLSERRVAAKLNTPAASEETQNSQSKIGAPIGQHALFDVVVNIDMLPEREVLAAWGERTPRA